MSDQENFEELEIPQVPRECVKTPPDEGYAGRVYPVECTDEECGYWGDMEVHAGCFQPEGICPDCKKQLRIDFSRHMWGIGTQGPGYHSTAWGRRRKQELIKRNDKLRGKQWETNAPGSVVNPERIVNATEGGVFDPNSRFNRHKKKNTRVIYKKD